MPSPAPSVAGGVVTRSPRRGSPSAGGRTSVSRAPCCEQGIGADLGDDAASEQELRRRANEVAILLRGAGVAVELEDRWDRPDNGASRLWLGAALAALSFGYAAALVLGLI